MKPSALRIGRLLAKVEAKLACSAARARRYVFHPHEVAEAEAQGLPYVLVPRVLSAAFRQGLEKRGWSEGSNVRIDYRFAPGGAHVQMLAKQLVTLQPDVILANSTPVTAALQRESSTIPIVFTAVADPIGSGFVSSLPRWSIVDRRMGLEVVQAARPECVDPGVMPDVRP